MKSIDYPVWPTLSEHASDIKQTSLAEMFDKDTSRANRFVIEAAGLYLDYSKNLVTDDTLSLLTRLADEASIGEKAQQMYKGALINNTEHRAALHTLLRSKPDEVPANLTEEHKLVTDTFKKMADIATSISEGTWTGYTGKPITDVIHLGIGGSYLGPNMVDEALSSRRKKSKDIKVHYVANVDAHHLCAVLEKVDPEQTLVIVVSKSFSTLETLTNANTCRDWLLTQIPASEISKHIIAVSTNIQAATEFGVAAENILPIWDWVGGRYSLWSAVSLPIMIRYGVDDFTSLLDGASDMDQHFLNADSKNNMPMMLALISIWYQHFFGAQSHAVLPYDHRLRLLPEHLQQLDMESNGKQRNLDGDEISYDTGAILWGGEGCNGQHAFHQLLHQGTRFCGIDFILALNPDHDHIEHHDKLVASCLSQSQALMLGRGFEELDQVADPVQRKHKVMPGNRPSNTIVLEQLCPSSLGALVALYEHKVFCQAAIWQINPFDQWGVELGKELGDKIFNAINSKEINQSALDASTKQLLSRYLGSTSRVNKRGQ